eukprot:1179096-Prorocentrum_minimum.AAC.5
MLPLIGGEFCSKERSSDTLWDLLQATVAGFSIMHVLLTGESTCIHIMRMRFHLHPRMQTERHQCIRAICSAHLGSSRFMMAPKACR